MGRWCALLLASLLVLSTACSSPLLDFSLEFKPREKAEPQLAARIGVEPFFDRRPQTRASANRKWLGLIPGVLWVDIATDVPEVYTVFTPFASRPLPDNMARALAHALDASSGLEVFFTPAAPGDRPDFILTGSVERIRLTERCYYYGSFMYAWLTRVFGLPYVSFALDMRYHVRLICASDRRVLWEKGFSRQLEDKYHTVYELGRGRDGKHLIASMISRVLAEDLKVMIPGIRAAIEGSGK